MELFFCVVEVWHLFEAEVTASQKFPQMTAETGGGGKNASINQPMGGEKVILHYLQFLFPLLN